MEIKLKWNVTKSCLSSFILMKSILWACFIPFCFAVLLVSPALSNWWQAEVSCTKFALTQFVLLNRSFKYTPSDYKCLLLLLLMYRVSLVKTTSLDPSLKFIWRKTDKWRTWGNHELRTWVPRYVTNQTIMVEKHKSTLKITLQPELLFQ